MDSNSTPCSQNMLTLPNLLSLLRIPLACAFLHKSVPLRVTAVLMAMVTDAIDGFLARRLGQASQIGAMLDPLADKFFMLFTLTIFLNEGRITPPQLAALLSRDFAVMSFGIYLGLTGGWATYQLRAIWAGKVSTALQLVLLLLLLLGVVIPTPVYWTFVGLGILALGELYLIRQKSHSS
jgi:CDP-diacylglycerol--glycerol-3-phosphate 3-phosphatidyltransferase